MGARRPAVATSQEDKAKVLATVSINVREAPYNAKGDGVADDTHGIQAALAAAAITGGVVCLPPGTYLVRGRGSECLLVGTASGRPVSLVGAGRSSVLKVASDVAAATDVLRVVGTSFTSTAPYQLRDFTIQPAAPGTPARHGINIDTTANAIAGMVIERLTIFALGGRAVTLTNPTRADGFFGSVIRDCYGLSGGVLLNRCGDSVTLSGNTISGKNCGIEVSFSDGAGSFRATDNTITCGGGGLRIFADGPLDGHTTNLLVQGNFFELSGGVSDAVIDLAAARSHPIYGPVIRANRFNPPAGCDNIRLGYVDTAMIDGNTLNRARGRVQIRVSPGATRTRIGVNRLYPDNDPDTTVVEDLGTDTQFFRYGGEVAVLTAKERDAIAVAPGRTIFNRTTGKLQVWTGRLWETVTSD